MPSKSVDHSRRTVTYRSSVSRGLQGILMLGMTLLGFTLLVISGCVALAQNLVPIEDSRFYTDEAIDPVRLINYGIYVGRFVIDNWIGFATKAAVTAIAALGTWMLYRSLGD